MDCYREECELLRYVGWNTVLLLPLELNRQRRGGAVRRRDKRDKRKNQETRQVKIYFCYDVNWLTQPACWFDQSAILVGLISALGFD